MFKSLKSRILVSALVLAIIVAVSSPWIGMFWLFLGAALLSVLAGLALAYLVFAICDWIFYGECNWRCLF